MEEVKLRLELNEWIGFGWTRNRRRCSCVGSSLDS